MERINSRDDLTPGQKFRFFVLKKTVLDNPYIPQQPTVKQAKFLVDLDEEVLYGGAAGGGKSSALLMGALQFVQVPRYSSIVFRRTFQDLKLPDALMPRAHEWLQPTDAEWSANKRTWFFPTPTGMNASLTFGYLQYEPNKYRYQSSAYQYIAFDELTQFTESQYTYLFGRLRRLEGSSVPPRMRGATNPHDNWVKERFHVTGTSGGAKFISAKMEDNPHLDTERYRETLEHLNHVDKKRLRDGDWDVVMEGNMFKRYWFEIIAKERVPANIKNWVRYWDRASSLPSSSNPDPDFSVGVLMGEKDGIYYVKDVQRTRGTPQEMQMLIRQTAELDGHDVKIFKEEEPGSSGKDVIDYYSREVLKDFYFEGDRSTGSKVARATPLSSSAEAGNIKLVSGEWNEDFLAEFNRFPGGSHDDQVDATAGAYNKIGQLISERPEHGTAEDMSLVGSSKARQVSDW